MTFTDKLRATQARAGSVWGMPIAPDIEKLPIMIARYDDPYLPLARAIHQATQDLVCAYLLDFTAYLKLGAAGAVALERSIDLLGSDHVVLVDGAFASDGYAPLWEETAFGMDGVTLAQGYNAHSYQQRPDRAAFPYDTGAVDTRDKPTYWLSPRTLGIADLRIRLLPADLIERSRSLTFEETLRERVEGFIRDAR
jgi:hypothetical protein